MKIFKNLMFAVMGLLAMYICIDALGIILRGEELDSHLLFLIFGGLLLASIVWIIESILKGFNAIWGGQN